MTIKIVPAEDVDFVMPENVEEAEERFEVLAWTPAEDLGKPIILSPEDWEAFTADAEEEPTPEQIELMRRLMRGEDE